MPEMIFAENGEHTINIKCLGLQMAGHPAQHGAAAVNIADPGS